MVRRDEGGRGNRRVLVNNRSFHNSLDALDSGGLGVSIASRIHQKARTYVYNAAERPNCVWPVDGIRATTSILHNCACDHNNILRRMRQLLNSKMNHLPKAGIFVLEELRDAEE